MDFATDDFSNLLLARTACQRRAAACVRFSQHPSQKGEGKEKAKDRLTFGDFEPWQALSSEEV